MKMCCILDEQEFGCGREQGVKMSGGNNLLVGNWMDADVGNCSAEVRRRIWALRMIGMEELMLSGLGWI
jgi:hypothetical protein